MLIFFRCLGKALVSRGMRGLMGMVPLGEQVFEIARDTIENYRQLQREQELAADLEAVVRADMGMVRAEAQKVAREVAAGQADAEIAKVEAYLAQVSSVARQQMRRPNDPTGTTVPADWNFLDPIRLAAVVPKRAPRFQAGESVPNAPQWLFEHLLGSGGFGEVWLARHSFLQKLQAFKFCLDAESRERLLHHEAEVVRRVMQASGSVQTDQHGIVPLLDVCLMGDTPWLAYEYVEGGDLTGLMLQMKTADPVKRAANGLTILRQLAIVIGKFHQLSQPIVHRDLKPANILTRRGPRGYVLRVTDFGISQMESDRALRAATVSTPSIKLGETYRGAHTPMYASPQQKRGQKADVRDDVYALGILGYQLLLGDVGAERPGGKWRSRLSDCQVSEVLLDLLESCWDDDPNERPRDALVLAQALERELRDPWEKRLDRWRAGDSAKNWVAHHADGWTRAQLVDFLAEINQSEFGPLPENAVIAHLDSIRSILRAQQDQQYQNHLQTRLEEQRQTLAAELQRQQEELRKSQADYENRMRALQATTPPIESALPQNVPPQPRSIYTNSLGMKFAWIPPGAFLMGSPEHEEHRKDDENQVQVQISKGFYLGVYTVTQVEYERITGKNPSYFSSDRVQQDTRRFPVECISWFDAVAFCNVLSENDGLPRYYRMDGNNVTIPSRYGPGYRLPTEAEWEYACRAGTGTPFHFGTSLSGKEANINGNKPYGVTEKGPYLQRTTVVGSYAPSNFGLYDMHGNVSEWCLDFYKKKVEGGLDPCVPMGAPSRLVRGGSWEDGGFQCRSAHRFWYLPQMRRRTLGFRVVVVPPGS